MVATIEAFLSREGAGPCSCVSDEVGAVASPSCAVPALARNPPVTACCGVPHRLRLPPDEDPPASPELYSRGAASTAIGVGWLLEESSDASRRRVGLTGVVSTGPGIMAAASLLSSPWRDCTLRWLPDWPPPSPPPLLLRLLLPEP